MMTRDLSREFVINDHVFLEAIRCPLKINFLFSNYPYETNRPVYRQRNKLNVRDAVAARFLNYRHTPDSTIEAISETEKWFSEPEIAICGAVVKSGRFITRIPILVKNGNQLTIIQIHGKLRKQIGNNVINRVGSRRTENGYLLKAAYRAAILKRVYPEYDINVDFYFPKKDFRSTANMLHRHKDFFRVNELVKNNLNNLFTKTVATKGVEMMMEGMPAGLVHKSFAECSVDAALEIIGNLNPDSVVHNIARHKECGYCSFRKTEDSAKSCWEIFYSNEKIKKPDRHVFELMGHGNHLLVERGVYHQENVIISDGLNSFEKMKAYGGPNITIQQRRNLQILKAGDEKIPALWMKPGMRGLKNLGFPLHFLDFEAATYAIPMKRGDGPYTPVYFQFSCVTVHEDGSSVLSEWIDTEIENADPHKTFVDELGRIPHIFDGTIIQYSPFEQQAVNNLIREFQRNSMENRLQIELLEKIRSGSNSSQQNRFFDLNAWIRNFYYNEYLEEGLGLKQVLDSILFWDKQIKTDTVSANAMINSSKVLELAEFLKEQPYNSIQENGSGITDGSAAMNAWISMKNGLLTAVELETVPKVLKKYCALDAYAMVYIYFHLINLLNCFPDDEIVLFEHTESN